MLDLDNNGTKETIALKLSSSTPFTAGDAAGKWTLAYSNLKTANGAAVPNGTVAISAGNAIAADTTSPTLLSARLTDVDSSSSVSAGDTIELIFDEPVKVPATGTLTMAALGTGNRVAQGGAWNKLVITLGANPTLVLDTAITGEHGGTALVNPADANQIKDYSNVAWDTQNTNRKYVMYPDGVAAPAVSGDITVQDNDSNGRLSVGDTITIPFDRTLDSSLDIDESKITIANKAAGTTFTAAANGKNVVLTFTAVDNSDATNYTVDKTVAIEGAGSNIKSTWGMETGDLTAKRVTLNTTNVPHITAASFDRTNRKLYVTFDEPVFVTGDVFAGDNSDLDKIFEVSAGYDLDKSTTESPGNPVSVALDANDTTNKTIVLTLADGEFVIDEGVTTLNIIAGGAASAGTKIVDFEGNQPKRSNTTGVVIQTK